MQPGTGPWSVTSTTKYRQRTRRRYPPADKPSWNSGHSRMRSGDAGQGAQKSGSGRLLRPLVMTQVWLSSPHRSRHSCDGERHIVARFLRADQVQARTDVLRTVRDRAATSHGWTIAVVQHLVRRRIKRHEPSVFSTCRALPKVRKAARAKRLRFGGPSAGSCGQERVRSRACHRPRLDRTRKRRCVSNAPQTVPVPRPSLARCWSNADTAAAMTAAPSRPREPSRCTCCRTIAAAKASNSSARGTATRATAMS